MRILKSSLIAVKYISIIILIIIFISNFYVMIASVKNPGTHPSVLGYSSAVVISGSMEPAISINDLIFMKKENTYTKGDIIAFKSGKSFVTHRITEVTPDGFVTKGDANSSPDTDLVKYSDISGKVIFTVPKIGAVTGFLKSPFGMMLIILVGFAIILAPEKTNKQ